MASMTPDARLSPSIRTPGSEIDPFNLNPSSSGRRHRYSSFDTTLFSSYSPSSPTQAKRTIEAHLADKDRQIEDASKVSNSLLDQRNQLEARLKELEARQNSSYMAPEARSRLAELERYNEMGRESPKQFVPKKPRTSYAIAEDGTDGDFHATNGRPSPLKSAFDSPKKSRNGITSDVQDIELATQISQSLLAQLRTVQNKLAEKEEALRRANVDKATMQSDAEVHALKVRSMDEHEQRIKDENWQLELQNQRLMTEIKEAAAREQRLTHSINNARNQQSAAEREYDGLRTTHDKLRDDHETLRRQLDAEMMDMHRSIATRDAETENLQKKLEQLSAQNEDLVKAAAYRQRMDQENMDAAAVAGADGDMLEPTTPDASPPGSPVKATPRHGALESETLKSSLHHAHKMIQNLKNNIHREKTEKIELRKLLQDVRDELEARKADVGGASANAGKKRLPAQSMLNKAARPDKLGGSKGATEEIINDPSWEEYDDSPTKPRANRRRDLYDLSTDASDAFETANEDDQMSTTETEGFQTGFETLPGESEDELTETEESQNFKSRGTTLARLNGASRVRSFQSTASDDTEFFNSNTSMPNFHNRYQLKSSRNQRSTDNESNDIRDSPASVASGIAGNRGGAHNLASELEDLAVDGSIGGSTPSRQFDSKTSTPDTRLRDSTPIPYSAATPVAEKVDTFDKGTMTEPWEPETIAAAPTVASTLSLPSSIFHNVLNNLFHHQGTTADAPSESNTASDAIPTVESGSIDVAPTTSSLNVSPLRFGQTSEAQKSLPFGILPARSVAGDAIASEPQPDMGTPSSLRLGSPPTGTNLDQTSAITGSESQTQKTFVEAAPAAHTAESIHIGSPVSDQSISGTAGVMPANDGLNTSTEIPNSAGPTNAATSAESQTPQVEASNSAPPSMSFVDKLLKRPSQPPVHPDSTIQSAAQGASMPVQFQSSTLNLRHEDVPGLSSQPPTTTHMLDFATGGQTFLPNNVGDIRSATVQPPSFAPGRTALRPRSLSTGPAGAAQDTSRNFAQTQPAVAITPEQARHELPGHDFESFGQSNYRPPFRTVSGNAPGIPSRLSREPLEADMDQSTMSKREGKRPAGPDNRTENGEPDGTRRTLTPILSSGSPSPGRNGRSSSLTARFSTAPATYIEPDSFGPIDRPASAGGSSRNPGPPIGPNMPPLPNGHRQVIASQTPQPGTVMGPPQMPPSSWRGSSQSRSGPANTAQQPGAMVASMPQNRVASFAKTEATHRSSMSSYNSEFDTHRSMRSNGPEDMNLLGTDPRMIQAITQTMIGEYLWKYTRKTGRDEHSAKRHRRFFWIHPYTRTLYWSNQDPAQAGKTELKAKSVGIEAVRVVSDDSHNPPGLHIKSIIVVTPGRSIKFTAPTAQRHETWFNALSYLLLRNPTKDGNASATTLDRQSRGTSNSRTNNTTSSRPIHQRSDTQSSINSEDVSEFNPSMQSRSASTSRRSQSRGRTPTTFSDSQSSTSASRYAPPLPMIPQFPASQADTHPAMRQPSMNSTSIVEQSQSTLLAEQALSGAAPAPGVPTINPKDITSNVEENKPAVVTTNESTTGPSSDGFKKPEVPPPRSVSANSTKRGRMGSITDRFSSFVRGRSKSRGGESVAGSIAAGGEAASAQESSAAATMKGADDSIPPVPKMANMNGAANTDGPGLENVRACCDGKHDVSDLSHHSHSVTSRRQSSRSRTRVDGVVGDAVSWRSRFSDAASISPSVPTLTRDVR